MKKLISEAEMIPKFYGIAWVDYPRNLAVCYPLPLNKIVYLGRELLHWLKRAPPKNKALYAVAYTQGCDDTKEKIRQWLEEKNSFYWEKMEGRAVNLVIWYEQEFMPELNNKP